MSQFEGNDNERAFNNLEPNLLKGASESKKR